MGFAVPPCIIFKGKVYIQGWFKELALPDDWRLEVSANGWTIDEITYWWLRYCFIPATTAHTRGKY
jgi:hypothetical protein